MKEKIEDNGSDRRSFIRKLAAAAGVGVAGLLLQQELIKPVSAQLAGDVAFSNGAGGLAYDHSNLFWDNTNKRLGIGTASPARAIHLVGSNACFRMDRNANSSAFILVRTDPTSFTTIWKTFYVGVDASGVNNGSFFIGDVGTAVGGPSAKRLLIDNAGNVGIGTTNPQALFHVAGTSPNIIMGDSGSTVTAGVVGATISGGGTSVYPNKVTDDYGTVGGGRSNQAGDDTGTTSDRPAATVGGGGSNTASAGYATVCGGSGNQAISTYATIGGGVTNTASGSCATVGGGSNHTASGNTATIGGGATNTASGNYATVGGGWTNTASGIEATVPGGADNAAAGGYSFAAGRRAKANHQGAFVWADSTDADFASSANNQFDVRAAGGTRIFSDSGATVGVLLAAGASSWSMICDRNLKENFVAVDGRDVLERLSRIPITQWNLKSQDPSIQHIGPMAQDFYEAFGLGEDDRHISTVDADGIALVSIQALYQMVKEENEELRTELYENKVEIRELRARLEALEQTIKPTLHPEVS